MIREVFKQFINLDTWQLDQSDFPIDQPKQEHHSIKLENCNKTTSCLKVADLTSHTTLNKKKKKNYNRN